MQPHGFGSRNREMDGHAICSKGKGTGATPTDANGGNLFLLEITLKGAL